MKARPCLVVVLVSLKARQEPFFIVRADVVGVKPTGERETSPFRTVELRGEKRNV